MCYLQHFSFFFHLNVYDLMKKPRKFLRYGALVDFLILIIAKTEEETFLDRHIKPYLEV